MARAGTVRLRWVALVALLVVVIAALALGLTARSHWHRWQAEFGIETLEWHGLRFSPRSASVARLTLSRRSETAEQLSLSATDVQLRWDSLRHLWPLQSLHIGRLDLAWQPGHDQPTPEDETTLPDLADIEDALAHLPAQLDIEELHLSLPCADRRCLESGSLHWSRAQQTALPARLELNLRREGHQAQLTASAQHVGEAREVQLTVALDGQPRLQSRHQLTSPDAQTLDWQGTLSMGSLPEAPWLLAWLGDWTAIEVDELPTTPEQMRLGMSWSLSLVRGHPAAGQLRGAINLPSPWPLPGVGLLQGDLELAAAGESGVWTPSLLSGDLQVQPSPELIEAIPAELRPASVHLRVSPATRPSPDDRLALQIQASGSGASTIELQSSHVLVNIAPFSFQFDEARVTARTARMTLPQALLSDPRADLRLAAELVGSSLSFSLLPRSSLSLAGLSLAETPAFKASRMQAQLGGLKGTASLEDGAWQLRGPLQLRADAIAHPPLQVRPWQWEGQLAAGPQGLSLDGLLHNDVGLRARTKLDQRFAGGTTLDLVVEEIFLLAGNPLAASFTDWPGVLELSGGRLQARGQLQLPAQGPMRVNATVSGRGLSGIHDRVEFEGFAVETTVDILGDTLQADLSQLSVEQINPGFSLGPLHFRGRYQASLAQPEQGQLNWTEAGAQVLGGTVTVAPGGLDLATWSPAQQVQLRGLELDQLFAAYPAQGLRGSGTIDGQFELQRSAGGFVIEQGSLAARAPGVLRFDSPQIQALGRTNPAMQFVTEALENFHYQLLDSDIRYDERGLLQLGLRLHGSNPDLERGRPINFNINLEEDIPALLTSLQLSDRVSEIIRRRVQQRLEGGATTVTP